MSISITQSNIRKAKTNITNLRKKLSKEQDDYAKTIKDILKVKKEISRTSSQSTIRSKLTKLDRLNKTIEKTTKEQSTLNKKIVDVEKKLHRYEEQLLKKEMAALKQTNAARTQMEQEQHQNQQLLLDELYKYKEAIDIHTSQLDLNHDEEQYDVFISHASDDKQGFVEPLAALLKDSGVAVWYDEYKLTWGKPTRRSIDKGLAKCRFGIVVLSEHFFRKGWTNYELDGLVGRNVSEKHDLILPIWHNVGYEEVKKFSPPLADITALQSDNMAIEEIADQLIALLTTSSFDEEE
ncbi:toll/interleukin-1 receptor domain-containing protein [Bacillus sp. SH5-2]|uniref:toll/interleukin-1 receptor domain-containing protein n=1 Tax=Bacillus sp. SH5-2 TaxID=2217834 RepID=UPI0011EF18B6|nr:toll/interleukin-1 receptor domain-containing protein [Bacillus sp. SH5-2]KAA0766435.1 toll/interleukin-1 receptor domain-containing protein [Bacillus sp. SH5-2]